MAISRTCIIKIFSYFLIILILYSAYSEARCRRFDGKTLGNIDFNELSGNWNIVYTSDGELDKSCSRIDYKLKEGTTVIFNVYSNSTQNSSGAIVNCESNKLEVVTENATSSFRILDTDYKNYLLTYQCTEEVVDGQKLSKEVYRVLSRQRSIETPILQKYDKLLKDISNDILMSPVSQFDCQKNQKECRQFEDKVVKDLHLKRFSGHWNLLFTSDKDLDPDCTKFENNLISSESYEFVKNVKCDRTSNGLVSKSPFSQKSSKLLFALGRNTSSLWVLQTDYNDFVLTYECTKEEVNGMTQTRDVYRISGRNKLISGSSLYFLKDMLRTISDDIILSSVSHSNCECNQISMNLPHEESIVQCRSLPSVDNLNKNKIDGKWKLLFHNNTTKSCFAKQISETKGEVANTMLFFETIDGETVTSGLYSLIENGKLLRRVKEKSDQNTTILYVDSNVFISYQCHLDFSSSKFIENIEIYGRSNRFQDSLPANALAKLNQLGLKDKVFKLDNRNCKVSEECPSSDGLAMKSCYWKQLTGKWYRIYSTDDTKCINWEVEKSQIKLSSKRYLIKRQSNELLSSGYIRLGTNGQLIVTSLDEVPSIYHVIGTNYRNYLIVYRCLPNNNSNQIFSIAEVTVLSRSKDLNPQTLDLAYSKFNETGIDLVLKPVDQINCSYEQSEELLCRDIRDKALLNSNLNKFHGVWYLILFNQPGTRCIRVQDNSRALSDPSNRDEYWYDILDEGGIQGYGRAAVNEDGRLSELNFMTQGDRKLYVLDTDYDNYQVYYQCAIANTKRSNRKIVEYGLMARQQSVNSSIVEKTRKIFSDIGLGEVHPVDQENCQFKNMSKRPGINDNHCKNVEKFVINNVDLDKLTGKWFSLYTDHSGQTDVSSIFDKSSNSSSKYSHTYQTRFNDRAFRGNLRLDKSGIMYATSTSHLSIEEFKYNILDTDYNSYLITYTCIELDGSLSRIEKFHVLSRSCTLGQFIRDRATKIAKELGFKDSLSEVIQYQCREDLKYESHVLSKSCRRFHDTEIDYLDFEGISGQWDLQLISSADLQYQFDYSIKKLLPNNQLQTTNYKDSKPISTEVESHIKDSTLIKKNINGILGNAAVISTDYSSYLLTYTCQEHEENGLFRASEILHLITRGNQSYDDLYKISSSVLAVSLIKITDLVSNLTLVKNVTEKQFGNSIKDEILDIVETYQKENQLSNQTDKDVHQSLNNICRHYSEDELNSTDLSTIPGNWSLDFTSYVNEKIPFDRVKIKRKSDNSYDIFLFNKLQLISHGIDYPSHNSKIFKRHLDGRRGRNVHLLANDDYRIVYFCEELQVNDTLTGREILRFYSREKSAKQNDWYSYVKLLISSWKAKTWDKISDLMQKLKPITRGYVDQSLSTTNSLKPLLTNYLTPKLQLEQKVHSERPISEKGDKEVHEMSTKNLHKSVDFNNESDITELNQKISGKLNQLKDISEKNDTEVYDFLEKNCQTLHTKELVEPIFNKVEGIWRVDYASWFNTIHPYDTIEFRDRRDRLHITRSLLSQVVANGSAFYVNGTKYLRQIVHGRRGIQAFLWTDYSNHLIVYLCQENFVDGVLRSNEVLKLLSRPNTPKGRDLEAYQSLIMDNMKDYTLEMISDLAANLRSLHNESSGKIVVNHTKSNSPKEEETCPNYDNISQKDIDFSRLTGRWDAIYTSNYRWDRDCIYAVDFYNKTSNSIYSEKHTNNKTHDVLMFHSNNNGRQIVIVDNTEFQSWILATDYETYKLSYTCYVKEIKGKKRRIDLQRLYTKNIEAKEFDGNLLEKLRLKSAQIGKSLEPIDRSKCIKSEL